MEGFQSSLNTAMDLIELTDNARQHLCDLLEMTEQTAVLLSITSKGCGGYSYRLQFVDSEFGGEVIHLDQTRRLIIDQKSLVLLTGLQMDYQDTGLETNFVFINPNETGRCGCNMSFTTTGCKAI